MIAAIPVLKAKRRPMSSVTFAIVACALRASAPPSGAPVGALSMTSETTAHNRRTNRAIASTLGSVHSMSWSAGPRNMMFSRHASAP